MCHDGVVAVTSDFDLLVVGGGLAGASFATALAREGARVLVVERGGSTVIGFEAR